MGTDNWSSDFSNDNFPANGVYTAHARAVDQVGNIEASPTATFTYDTTAPVLTLLQPSLSSTTNTLPLFSGDAGNALGDSMTITVNIYAGSTVAGSPIQILTTSRDDDTYSVSPDTALTGGTCTAIAFQSDLAGNNGVSNTSTFVVDDVPPVVLSIDPSDPTIADATVPGPFTLTITYSKPMDEATTPVITFPATGKDPTLAPPTLTFNAEDSGWFDNVTYVASYDVADVNVEMPEITVRVDGATDLVGNVQTQANWANNFSIDTLNPTVTGLVASPTWVVNNVSEFTVTVTYSEPMDPSPDPTITFAPDVAASPATLSFSAGAWSVGDTVYTATYTVIDQDVDLGGIQIDVTASGTKI